MGTAIILQVAVDGKIIGSIAPNTFHMVLVEPGDHTISIILRENIDFVNLTTLPFTNYFLNTSAQMGINAGRVKLTLVREEEGMKMIRKSRLALRMMVEPDFEAVSPPIVDVGSMPSIAILDFEGIGVSNQEALILTKRTGTYLVQLGHHQVIERGQMEQILLEQDFQLTGCTSDECAVEIGRLLGAQQMLAGSIGKFGTSYTIDMKIIDVETGRVLRTASYDSEGSINLLLTVGLPAAVRRIAGLD